MLRSPVSVQGIEALLKGFLKGYSSTSRSGTLHSHIEHPYFEYVKIAADSIDTCYHAALAIGLSQRFFQTAFISGAELGQRGVNAGDNMQTIAAGDAQTHRRYLNAREHRLEGADLRFVD
jgi:hypothetical protein